MCVWGCGCRSAAPVAGYIWLQNAALANSQERALVDSCKWRDNASYEHKPAMVEEVERGALTGVSIYVRRAVLGNANLLKCFPFHCAKVVKVFWKYLHFCLQIAKVKQHKQIIFNGIRKMFKIQYNLCIFCDPSHSIFALQLAQVIALIS